MNTYEKHDIIHGKVISSNDYGAYIYSEELDVLGFCFSCLNRGDTGWFTIVQIKQTEKLKRVIVNCDTITEYGELGGAA